jgi:hypothetical protein
MRFTIRDVLWLTVVAAVAVGWFVDRSRLRGEATAIASDLERVQASSTMGQLELAKVCKLWQVRAERLAERIRADGYQVTWSGEWNDHGLDIVPPK